MLKKQYDILFESVCTWLFDQYATFATARKYGQIEIKNVKAELSFMEIELLTFIHKANKRRNPERTILIPAGIDSKDFYRIVSNIKNKLL